MNEVQERTWKTHNWKNGVELPWCLSCGESPISLGYWGDEEWQDKNRGWESNCKGRVK